MLPPHHTSARYQRGCRCLDCKRANRDTKRAWRLRYNKSEQLDEYGLPRIKYPALEAWRDQAACGDLCRRGAAEAIWWVDPRHPKTSVAREICWRCPVREDCLAWAMRLPEPAGIWGGLTPAERNQP